MQVLILRPYRKDIIYFRTIEEREKITARIKKIRSKTKALEWSQYFPIITIWELSVAMEIMQPFPHPNDASVKI